MKKACFVIDSPMNALVASIIAKNTDKVEIIYAIDPLRKDKSEYLRVYSALLSGIKIKAEHVIEFDSASFWGGRKNDLLPDARKALMPLIKAQSKDFVYFGNCLTNPVALALKRFVNVNHLYHAPSDFEAILFPQKNFFVSYLKNMVKRIIRRELYKIEVGDIPIYSLLNINATPHLKCLNFNDFISNVVEKRMLKLKQELDLHENKIMLLLSGDDPEPGDCNPLNISKYLKPHFQMVEALMNADQLSAASLWIKEHKSYLPLTNTERDLLTIEFGKLKCSVFFIADYLHKEDRTLPGELMFKYAKFDYVISEASALLLNIAQTNVKAILAPSIFTNYRDVDQIERNNTFLLINEMLNQKCRVL